MLVYKIPGMGELKIENIVFDYNGTIAKDGKLIDGVKELLITLKAYASIYILTADTYGTAESQCHELGISMMTFPKSQVALYKRDIVEKLGADKTICIGNGFNDIEMLKVSKLSIAVIEGEGCSGKLITYADIVVTSIQDAIEILLKENRLKATLRN